MPSTVYRGSDGTISVAVESGVEGDKAAAVNEAYSLTPIGRVTGVTGALLKLMLGDAADSRPAGTFVSPSFNLSVRLENPSLPGTASTVTVMGVKLEEWMYELPEDDFAMEKVNFRALWVKVEDQTA
jgi:hypothetical protein